MAQKELEHAGYVFFVLIEQNLYQACSKNIVIPLHRGTLLQSCKRITECELQIRLKAFEMVVDSQSVWSHLSHSIACKYEKYHFLLTQHSPLSRDLLQTSSVDFNWSTSTVVSRKNIIFQVSGYQYSLNDEHM